MTVNPKCLADHQKPVLGECICIVTSNECKDIVTLDEFVATHLPRGYDPNGAYD